MIEAILVISLANLAMNMLGAARWKPSYEVFTDGLRREPREVPDLSED